MYLTSLVLVHILCFVSLQYRVCKRDVSDNFGPFCILCFGIFNFSHGVYTQCAGPARETCLTILLLVCILPFVMVHTEFTPNVQDL